MSRVPTTEPKATPLLASDVHFLRPQQPQQPAVTQLASVDVTQGTSVQPTAGPSSQEDTQPLSPTVATAGVEPLWSPRRWGISRGRGGRGRRISDSSRRHFEEMHKDKLPPIPPFVAMAPPCFVVAVILLSILSDVCIRTGGVSAPWLPQTEALLQHCVPSWRLANFWMGGLLGCLPILLTCYAWVALVCGSESALALAREAADGPLHLDTHRNRAHVHMVKLASQQTRLELVSLGLFVVYLALAVTPTLALSFLRIGLPGPGGRWAFVAIVGLLCLGVPPFMLRLGRIMRLLLVKQHGLQIDAHLDGVKRRAFRAALVQLSCLGYLLALAAGTAPVTQSIASLGLDGFPDPCAAVATAPSHLALPMRPFPTALSARRADRSHAGVPSPPRPATRPTARSPTASTRAAWAV